MCLMQIHDKNVLTASLNIFDINALFSVGIIYLLVFLRGFLVILIEIKI